MVQPRTETGGGYPRGWWSRYQSLPICCTRQAYGGRFHLGYQEWRIATTMPYTHLRLPYPHEYEELRYFRSHRKAKS